MRRYQVASALIFAVAGLASAMPGALVQLPGSSGEMSLPKAAPAASALKPALLTKCGTQESAMPWKYCITYTRGSRSADVLYYMHGGNGSEKEWRNGVYELERIREYWASAGYDAPTVAVVTFPAFNDGRHWLLTDKNAAPGSGLYAVFTEAVMPAVEQLIAKRIPGGKVRNRALLGVSMGSANAVELALKAPKGMFKGAALTSPAFINVDPFDEAAVKAYSEKYFDMTEFVQFIKMFIPDTEHWNGFSPFILGPVRFSPDTPRLYISSGDKDWFNPNPEEFARLAIKGLGERAVWHSVAGQHGAMDHGRVGEFLISVLNE